MIIYRYRSNSTQRDEHIKKIFIRSIESSFLFHYVIHPTRLSHVYSSVSYETINFLDIDNGKSP